MLTTSLFFAGNRDHEEDALWVDGTKIVRYEATYDWEHGMCSVSESGATLGGCVASMEGYELDVAYDYFDAGSCSAMCGGGFNSPYYDCEYTAGCPFDDTSIIAAVLRERFGLDLGSKYCDGGLKQECRVSALFGGIASCVRLWLTSAYMSLPAPLTFTFSFSFY